MFEENLISPRARTLKKNLKKIQKFSSMVETKLRNYDKDEKKIEKLSFEELQDFHKLLQIADFILTKYEDKKQVYNLIKDFVDMISNSSNSMDFLDDKISELVVSAQSTISRIKTIQTDMSENYSLIQSKTA
jgi:hypothetical protein